MLHSYACQAAIKGLHTRKDLGWAWGYLKVLGSLARSMAYLVSLRTYFPGLLYINPPTCRWRQVSGLAIEA